MSNFDFLQTEWPLVFEAAHRAEASAYSDARAACFYARRALELAVTWLYTHDKTFKLPYQDNLNPLIYEPSFRAGRIRRAVRLPPAPRLRWRAVRWTPACRCTNNAAC